MEATEKFYAERAHELKFSREPEFYKQVLLMKKELSSPKKKSSSRKETLIQKLDDYLEQRKNITDSHNQTKEYFYGSFFSFFQKSYTEKKKAIEALKNALNEEPNEKPVDLKPYLSTLRNGNLGKTLRAFIKSGDADSIVNSQVHTVREFVAALNTKNNISTSKIKRD